MRYLSLLLVFISLAGVADEKRTFIANTLISPPYIYERDGQLTGSAIDLVDEMFRRAGNYRVDYIALPWKRAVMKTQAGEGDMLIYAGKSESRKRWGHYIDSVLIKTRFVLFKLRGVALQLNPDFSNGHNYRLGVRRGYIYQPGDFLNAINHRKFKSVLESGSTAQSIELLNRGRIDFFVGDYLPVMHHLALHGLEPEIDVVRHNGNVIEIFQVPTYLLLSKEHTSPELNRALLEALESMKADGTYDKLVGHQSRMEQR